jgi:hypothetical protein
MLAWTCYHSLEMCAKQRRILDIPVAPKSTFDFGPWFMGVTRTSLMSEGIIENLMEMEMGDNVSLCTFDPIREVESPNAN